MYTAGVAQIILNSIAAENNHHHRMLEVNILERGWSERRTKQNGVRRISRKPLITFSQNLAGILTNIVPSKKDVL